MFRNYAIRKKIEDSLIKVDELKECLNCGNHYCFESKCDGCGSKESKPVLHQGKKIVIQRRGRL